MKDARKSWGGGDVKQEKKIEGNESKHRMKETGDSIIGQNHRGTTGANSS